MKRLAAIAAVLPFLAGAAASAEIFADSFETPDLSVKWEITRANPDAMAVENGELLLLSSSFQSIEKEEITNVLMPRADLPPGDWTMHIAFTGEFRTAREELLFGITAGKLGETDVWASVGSDGDKYDGWSIYGAAGRTAAGRSFFFKRPLLTLGCNVCPPERMFDAFARMVPQPIEARLRKMGWQYVLSVKLGPEKPWVELERVTAIGVAGRPFIVLRQREDTEGETLVRLQSVTIQSP